MVGFAIVFAEKTNDHHLVIQQQIFQVKTQLSPEMLLYSFTDLLY